MKSEMLDLQSKTALKYTVAIGFALVTVVMLHELIVPASLSGSNSNGASSRLRSLSLVEITQGSKDDYEMTQEEFDFVRDLRARAQNEPLTVDFIKKQTCIKENYGQIKKIFAEAVGKDVTDDLVKPLQTSSECITEGVLMGMYYRFYLALFKQAENTAKIPSGPPAIQDNVRQDILEFISKTYKGVHLGQSTSREAYFTTKEGCLLSAGIPSCCDYTAPVAPADYTNYYKTCCSASQERENDFAVYRCERTYAPYMADKATALSYATDNVCWNTKPTRKMTITFNYTAYYISEGCNPNGPYMF